MKSFKVMLEGMTDSEITVLAVDIWDSYEDDGEDGIGAALGVDPKEAVQMLDAPFDIDTPEQLAEAMRAYRDGTQWEPTTEAIFALDPAFPFIRPEELGPDADTEED